MPKKLRRVSRRASVAMAAYLKQAAAATWLFRWDLLAGVGCVVSTVGVWQVYHPAAWFVAGGAIFCAALFGERRFPPQFPRRPER